MLAFASVIHAADPGWALDAGASAAPVEERIPPPQPLPEYTEPRLPPAGPAELARVDGLLDALLAPELALRVEALGRIQAVDPTWLPAVAERFERVASSSTKAALDILLDEIRARANAPSGTRRARRPPTAAPGDLLELVVRHPDRSSAYLRPLTEVLAYSRMFEAIRTSAAARGVVSVYLRFGERLRVDTEQALARMGDAALAALIESTAHPERRVAEWAKRQLETMGKSVASEAVQVTDPALRADILLAYGKARDTGTTRLLIAFAASERAQVRLAARQAVALLGELGLWELRDAYETTTGASAPGDWSWRRVAEELFARFDGQRLAEVYGSFAAGRAALARGDLEAARAAFDEVLARDPLFERGALMVPAYIAYAEQVMDSDPEAAGLALRRAERLAPEGPEHDRALSLRYTLDARALARRGLVDETLIERARALDPNNRHATALEAELSAQSGADRATFRRYAAALAIVVLTLLSLLGAALRLRQGRSARARPSK
ncbi:MAG TPA: hypothetical protein VNN80_18080 [Polyangiaceae bacterium]|nr:hypothetical protein [Polyangiaceae bacterium]